MQDRNELYTTQEEVELLLKQTRDSVDKHGGKKPKDKKKLSVGKIIRRVIYGVLVISLLFMLGKVWLARINGETPSLFGYQLYVVETGSMIPTLPIGSNILMHVLQPDDVLKVGDVVTYNHSTAAVTHRIIELVTRDDGVLQYQTKGDNPDNSPDPWLVSREDIRGVMIWSFSWPQLFK